jgi:hypothetical protein
MDNPHACLRCNKYLHRIRALEAAANEVLRVYMHKFNDSRAVDDCLVGLAAVVAGVASDTATEQKRD